MKGNPSQEVQWILQKTLSVETTRPKTLLQIRKSTRLFHAVGKSSIVLDGHNEAHIPSYPVSLCSCIFLAFSLLI